MERWVTGRVPSTTTALLHLLRHGPPAVKFEAVFCFSQRRRSNVTRFAQISYIAKGKDRQNEIRFPTRSNSARRLVRDGFGQCYTYLSEYVFRSRDNAVLNLSVSPVDAALKAMGSEALRQWHLPRLHKTSCEVCGC